MFIAALFTIVRTWKQPRCPLKSEWIKKTGKSTNMWKLNNMLSYNQQVKKEITRKIRKHTKTNENTHQTFGMQQKQC